MINQLSTSIVVCSSQKYRSLIEGFIFFLNKNWSNCPYDIFFSLEKESMEDLKGITFINSISSDWSTRLYLTLNVIKSDYIILMLDDYYIFNPIDSKFIQNAIYEMKKSNLDHLSFDFGSTNALRKNLIQTSSKDFQLYALSKNILNYQYNVVCEGFYNRESLMRLLRKNESPWEFEQYASLRSVLNRNFSSSKVITNQNPLGYISGGVIMKGEIRQEAKKYFSKYNYNFNFSKKNVKVSTSRTPLQIRLVRKIVRFLKIIIHVYFGKLKYS